MKNSETKKGTNREALLREYFLNASLLASLKQAGEQAKRSVEDRGLKANLVPVRGDY